MGNISINSVHGVPRNNKLWNQNKSLERQFWHMDLCASDRSILGDPVLLFSIIAKIRTFFLYIAAVCKYFSSEKQREDVNVGRRPEH